MKLKTLKMTDIIFSEDGRGKITKVSVKELMDSIEKDRLIQPITVALTDKGKFKLIAGRRRYKAFEFLKRKEIPCIIEKATEQEAWNMQIVENLQRKDLTPIQFANTLEECKLKTKMDIKEIALKTGKSQAYIVRIASLNNLIPKVKSWLDKEEIDLSVALEFARYDKVIQKDIIKELGEEIFFGDDYERAMTADELRGEIEGKYFTNLKDVPWKLDDEQLIPKAGSCAKCPKRTKATEFLFDDMDDDNCLDAECFAAKHKRVVEQKIDKIDKTGADYRLIVPYYISDTRKKEWKEHYGKQILGRNDYEPEDKRFPKKLIRRVGIVIDSQNPKEIAKTFNIILVKDIQEWEISKTGSTSVEKADSEMTAKISGKDKSVDDYYNSKRKKNLARSRYAASRLIVKEILKRGIPVSIPNLQRLTMLIYDLMDYTAQKRALKSIFPDKEIDVHNIVEITKLVEKTKTLNGVCALAFLLIMESCPNEPEYYSMENGCADALEELASNCGIDLKPIKKEADKEFEVERKHLKERFVKNHKRQPKEN